MTWRACALLKDIEIQIKKKNKNCASPRKQVLWNTGQAELGLLAAWCLSSPCIGHWGSSSKDTSQRKGQTEGNLNSGLKPTHA